MKKPVETAEPAWMWPVFIAGSVWALAVAVSFFQKSPFPLLTILDRLIPKDLSLLPTAAALKDYAFGLTSFIALSSSAYVLGRLSLRRFFPEEGPALEKVVFAYALGYGIISLLALGLGLTGLLYKNVFRGLIYSLFALYLLGLTFMENERNILKAVRQELRTSLFPSVMGGFFGVLIVFLVLTCFVMAFVPELFYDALVYHLAVPNYYLSEHRIAPLHLMTSKFPLTVQMIHLVGLALKDEMVTKLTHGFFLVLVMSGMMALGRRFQKPLWGLLAAVIFASIPTAQMNAWTSGVDMGVSLFGFLAFYSLVVCCREGNFSQTWWVFSGIYAGLAAASKYTAVYIPASIVATLTALLFMKKIDLKKYSFFLFIFGAICVAILVPWFVKNAIETGNPVYPFLGKIFPTDSVEPWRYDILRHENYGLRPKSVWGIPKLFWDLSINERSSLSFQGPMFLMLLPFLAVFWNKEKQTWFTSTLVFTGVFLVLGFLMTRLTRFLLPGFTAIACLLGLALDHWISTPSALRRFFIVFIVSMAYLLQVSWCYMVIGSSFQPRNVLLGKESRLSYIDHYHSGMNPNPAIQMYRYMEQHFLPGQKVLILGDEKAYPIRVPHTYSGVYDRGLLVRFCEQSSSPEEVLKKFNEAGITHLMINIYESHRIGGYGIYSMSAKAYGVFCAFWDDYLGLTHVEYAALSSQDKNPLVLLELKNDKNARRRQPVNNLLMPIFEKLELERIGLTTPAQLLTFYETLSKDWPKVESLKSRVQYFRSVKGK